MKSIAYIIIVFLIVGCSSGTGDGLDTNGQPLSDQSTKAVPLAANFQAIQDNVFTPICIVCHAGAAAPLGLKLDANNSYAFLVGMASTQESGLLRVDPGDPENSYLIQKLEGTAKVGSQMPLGRSALPQSTIDLIKQWIAEGALNTVAPVTEPGTAPIVTSITPDNGATITSFPDTSLIVFSQPIDASSLNSDTFSLVRSGGDGNFEDGNEIELALPVSLSTINPNVANIDMSGLTDNDTYRITLVGTGNNGILNNMAIMLDGDEDGAPGGDFQSTFTVAPLTPPTTAGGDGSVSAFQTIQTSVFTPVCTLCHAGPGAPEGLQLDEPNSYSNLLNVPSSQNSSLMLVNPGDPDNSYLIQKLEGNSSTGQQMPRGGPFLPQATIDFIRQWITDGATETDPPQAPSGGGAPPPPPPPAIEPKEPTVTPPPIGGGDGSIPAFQTIQTSVFTPVCTLCHAGPGAPEGLQLDEPNSYSNLLNVPSSQNSSLMLVNPGDPDNSYLIQKLEGNSSTGQQMPRGGPFLPQATIDFIRQWITDGATETDPPQAPSGGGAPPPPPPEIEPIEPTWRSIQDRIFTPICTQCHIGDDAPKDLRLDEANSYNHLINVESQDDDLRVEPGNADNSYLVKVLEGETDKAPRMPEGGPYLPQETIDTIRQWIDNGAQK